MALSCIPFVFPGVPHVRCAFQTRQGGVSEGSFGNGNIAFSVPDDPDRVRRNRHLLLATLGVPALAEVNQVHGDGFLCDPDPLPPFSSEPPTLPAADGHATSKPGLGLMIKTADCQPVLLAHKGGRHIAALHVGWRGNRIGFIASGIRTFCARYQLSPADLVAVRGPSLGPAKAEFINFDREWGPDYTPFFDPVTRTMDLWALTRQQLMDAGLPAAAIYSLDLCTASMPETFFSHRADKQSGRQASVIWIG